jgi:hypothetical protein
MQLATPLRDAHAFLILIPTPDRETIAAPDVLPRLCLLANSARASSLLGLPA